MIAGSKSAAAGIRDRADLLARLMIMSAIVYIAAMIGFPFVLAILYSLSDATTGDPALHLVGLTNFWEILADPVFRTSLKNTFVFALVSQSLVIILSRILATALMARGLHIGSSYEISCGKEFRITNCIILQSVVC